jgi:hypothetical protein
MTMAKGRTFRGVPPTVHRSVPSTAVRSVRYESGLNPYGISARESAVGVLGNLDQDAPTRDGPISGHGQQPDRRSKSKQAEVEANDPNRGLGETFDGTMVHR